MSHLANLRRAAAAALVGTLALLAAPLLAQAQNAVRVELGGTGPASQNLNLPRGQSAIVELPVDARDVLVSNPGVADAAPHLCAGRRAGHH